MIGLLPTPVPPGFPLSSRLKPPPGAASALPLVAARRRNISVRASAAAEAAVVATARSCPMAALLLVAAVLLSARSAAAHGSLTMPAARNVLWPIQAQTWWKDHGNGHGDPPLKPLSGPGICGDPFQHFNDSSWYSRMTGLAPAATYTAGQNILIQWWIQANHGGRISVALCPRATSVDAACFNAFPLERADGGGLFAYIMGGAFMGTTGFLNETYRLPAGVSCAGGCVLQWTWVTTNSCFPPDIGSCNRTVCGSYADRVNPVTGQSSMPDCCIGETCAASTVPEIFRNCADVLITDAAPAGSPSALAPSPSPRPLDTPSPSPRAATASPSPRPAAASPSPSLAPASSPAPAPACPTAPGQARADCFCASVSVYKYYADTANGCTGAIWCYAPGGAAYVTCTTGTLFNEALQVCDWPANVVCTSLLPASPSPALKASPSPALKASPSPALKASPSPALKASPSPALKASPSPALKASPSPALKASPSPALKASPSPALKASPSPALKASPSPALKASPSPALKASPSPATASPSPKPASSPSPTGAGNPIFSPYKDVTINLNWNTNVMGTAVTGTQQPLTAVMPAALRTVTLAFATGECGQELWGGLDAATFAAANMPALAAAGKRYIVATGGAAGMFTCSTTAGFNAFLARYMSASLAGIDFDIEGSQTQAQVNDLVTRAKEASALYPGLRFSFTVATLPNALGSAGITVVNALKALWPAGTAWTVNLMAMDYYGGCPSPCAMGQAAVDAATMLHTSYAIPWSQIELTPMVGGNDNPAEVFTLQDAITVSSFAKTAGLAGVHFWSFDRDRDCPAGAASPTCNTCSCGGTLGFTATFLAQLPAW